MKILLLLTITIIIGGCTSASVKEAREELRTKHQLNYLDYNSFKETFESNNVELIKLFIEANEGHVNGPGFPRTYTALPTKKVKLSSLLAIYKYEKLNDWYKDRIIGFITGLPQKNNCHEEEINFLMKQSYRLPKELQYLARMKAADVFCDKTLEHILSVYPARSHWALDSLTNSMREKSRSSFKNEYWSASTQGNIVGTKEVIQNYLSQQCNKRDDLKACRLSKKLDKILKGYRIERGKKLTQREKFDSEEKELAESYKKQEKYESSPQAIADKACRFLSDLNFSKRVISDQKKAASHSGYVDKRAMHQAGLRVESSRQLYKEFKAKYKKRTGRNPTCK